jgi:hypothetical protein
MSNVLMCPRCAYLTDRKANMQRHLTKKTLCSMLLKNLTKEQCINKVFNDNLDKNKEQLKLINKDDEIVDNHKNNNKKSTNQLINNTTNQININNTTNTTNITNNIIVINPFGKESIEHINSKYISNLVLKKPNAVIGTVVEMIYKEPCNKNIKLMGLNSGQMSFLNNNNEWIYLSKKDALYKMGTHGIFTINTKCNDEDLDIEDTLYNKIAEGYQEEDKHTVKKIVSNIDNYVKTEYRKSQDKKLLLKQ